MAEQAANFTDQLRARFADATVSVAEPRGEITLEVPSASWHAVALALRDEFGFEQAVDISGVDYLGYGSAEWDTADVSSEGFSRGVEGFGPAVRAERLCPQAVFVPPDFVRYKAVSRQVREIFFRHTDLVEPLSLDEAYLDVTAPKTDLPTATAVAETIRAQIREETRLTASAST